MPFEPRYFHPLYGLPDGQMGLSRYAEKRTELQRMGSSEAWYSKENKMYFSATNTRGNRASMFSVQSSNLKAERRKVPVALYGRYVMPSSDYFDHCLLRWICAETAVNKCMCVCVCVCVYETFFMIHISTLGICLTLNHFIVRMGRYRYSVYTYGHSGWSARLRELTFMNTTVFMEESPCHEWYHHMCVDSYAYLCMDN